MQQQPKKMETVSGLPPRSGYRLPSTGQPIMILRGLRGYWPMDDDPDQYNTDLGITPAQIEAMFAGSMFGWNVPAADPKIYERADYAKIIERGTTDGEYKIPLYFSEAN